MFSASGWLAAGSGSGDVAAGQGDAGSSCPLGSHLLVPRVQNPRPLLGWGVHHTPVNKEACRGPWAGLVAPLSPSLCPAAKALAWDQQAARQGDRIEPAEAGLSQWFTGEAINFVLVPYTPGPPLQLCRDCF